MVLNSITWLQSSLYKWYTKMNTTVTTFYKYFLYGEFLKQLSFKTAGLIMQKESSREKFFVGLYPDATLRQKIY